MSSEHAELYGGHDPVDLPAYTVADAARFLRLPRSTLTFWIRGGEYPTKEGTRHAEPVIELREPKFLSFRNLAEAHVLKALRRWHNITLPRIRDALLYIREHHCIEHPLTDHQVAAAGGAILVEVWGQLIDTKPPGQLAMRAILAAHLRRLDWYHDGALRCLFPFVRQHRGDPSPDEPKIVVIDPRVEFGRPTVNRGIRTTIINERFEAGESIPALAADLACAPEEIEEAIRYENAVRPYDLAA